MTPSDNDVSRPDPLIDEIRAIRKAISDEHGNDVDRLCAHLQEVQRRYADRVVRRSQTSPAADRARHTTH